MATVGPSSLVSPETCQSNFEQSVAISLHLWPALTLAVQNGWGGPDSADKRDWFAGAIVDLFPPIRTVQSSPQQQQQQQQQQQTRQSQPEEPDVVDVETVLLQVMLDEFDVNTDDDSGMDVATQIVRLRAQCAAANFDELDELRRRWEAARGTASTVDAMFKRMEDADQDTDWESDGSNHDNHDNHDNEHEAVGEDVDMDEAPPLVDVSKEKKPPPEVDEDGFIKVTTRRR